MTTLLAAILLAAPASPALADNPGGSAADFLNIGVGARQAAMGEAAAGLADDAAALYWNPAGLGSLDQQELAFQHAEWVQGVRYEHLAYAHPTAALGGWGVGLSRLDYGSIDSFDETGARSGTSSAYDQVASAGWGSPLFLDRVRVGAATKWVREGLASYSADAYSVDLGALASLWRAPAHSLDLGAGVRNAVGRLTFLSAGQPLPRTAYAGLGYRGLQERLAAALDLDLRRDTGLDAALGLEFWLHPAVAVRAGYRSGRDAGTGLSSGVGVKLGSLSVDYAFSELGSLGLIHRGQLTWRFGGLKSRLYAQGVDLMRQNRWAEALLTFNRVLQMDPTERRAVLRIRECRDALAQERKSVETR